MTPTPPARGDRPWWAVAVTALAVVPGLLALVALWLIKTVRAAVGGAVKSAVGLSGSGGRGRRPSPLLTAGAGGVLGYQFGKRRHAKRHAVIRVAGPRGEVHCRCATDPGTVPVAPGDTLVVWGRSHPDGTVRIDAIENRTTGVKHRPKMVAAWVPVAAAVSIALVLLAIASIPQLSG